MMRFLAVYSTAGFWFKSTNVENNSKNSEKKSKNFFSFFPLRITKNLQKYRCYALSNTFHSSIQNEERNTFFHFFIRDLNETHKKMMPQKFENFIIAVIEIFWIKIEID